MRSRTTLTGGRSHIEDTEETKTGYHRRGHDERREARGDKKRGVRENARRMFERWLRRKEEEENRK